MTPNSSDEIMLASHKLSATLMDPEFGHSNSAQHTAFNKAFGCGLIEYYLSVSLLPSAATTLTARSGGWKGSGYGNITCECVIVTGWLNP
jgi:hypothetical protein